MKFVSAAALALIGCLVGFNSANPQGAVMKTTPTTKILAIGTINPGFKQSQVFAVLPEEVRETVDLYLDGKIEQWYSLQGKPGVAFIINVLSSSSSRPRGIRPIDRSTDRSRSVSNCISAMFARVTLSRTRGRARCRVAQPLVEWR